METDYLRKLALCLLSACVAPLACRSVDTHEPPSEDLEPYVSHHHHDGNIAELLIPLLERSLAQSEARSTEHRRKPGKKVIQVLPYRGSEEHKRKGWRKLNSHKKQVVEITPLHGKDRAKPLAYILSAAKSSHDERAETNDVSSSNSDGERDKSTSEEQQSTEESKDENDRRADISESPSSSSNAKSSEEDKVSKNVSDKSSDVTAEDSDKSAEKVKDDRKFVLIEDSKEGVKGKLHKKHKKYHRHGNKDVTTEKNSESDVTLEVKEATIESGETTEESVTEEKIESSEVVYDSSNRYVTIENVDVTHEVTGEDVTVTAEDVTSEARAVTSEDTNVTSEDKNVTQENVTAEGKDVTKEEKSVTQEETVSSEVTIEKHDVATEEIMTSNFRVATDDLVTAENAVTLENLDVTEEKTVTSENVSVESATEIIHPRIVENRYNDFIDSKDVTDEAENDLRNSFIDNNIVISRTNQETESVEKNFGKIFNDRARDIIELIQSSVEASTVGHRDCVETPEKHHDHKSYRLSFLFNK
ncbi:uncharacterized protein LOC111359606 [Spodoptera litura]|uniref:Uncharacterized protein LOC111359606 n=1 Tax=Spodoptera litura TaxID=69820 RepID=A0A9J7EHU0_SPOLT|nr:uncharacterized protein LOC111359606 [Spodoptera litura]